MPRCQTHGNDVAPFGHCIGDGRIHISAFADLHRSGPASHQGRALAVLIQCDPHRNPLRQPNPGEGRIDVREQVRARGSFAILDAAGDALDVTFQNAPFPPRGGPSQDRRRGCEEAWFLRSSLRPGWCPRRSSCHYAATHGNIGARAKIDIGHPAVNRRVDFGNGSD